MKKPGSVDDYIRPFPPGTARKLRQLRAILRREAPDAEERLAYGIPTYYLNGNLVHFAGYAGHIGFYPGPEAIRKFSTRLGRYATSKGAVQFPLDEPLPAELIREIVAFRMDTMRKGQRARRMRADG